MSTFRAPRRLLLRGRLVAATAWGSAASAATIPVTTTGDELVVNSLCSVREAIRAANLDVEQDSCPAGSAVAQDVIRIPAGTYILGLGPAGDDVGTRGDLDVLGSVFLVRGGTAVRHTQSLGGLTNLFRLRLLGGFGEMPPENVAHTNAEHDDADDAGPAADPQDFVPPVEAHSVARGARRLLDNR